MSAQMQSNQKKKMLEYQGFLTLALKLNVVDS